MQWGEEGERERERERAGEERRNKERTNTISANKLAWGWTVNAVNVVHLQQRSQNSSCKPQDLELKKLSGNY